MIAKLKNYVNEVVKEMKKVSWPKREQLKESTNVVIVTTLIITGFVYIIDLVMNTIVGWYYSM